MSELEKDPADPILIKAARQLYQENAALKKSGQPKGTATQEEAYIRQLTNGKYGRGDAYGVFDTLHNDHANVVSSAMQGLSANFFDEIVGALPKFLGGGEAGKEGVRLRGDMMRSEHPVGDAVAQAAGGVGSALLLPEFKAASMGAKALQGAAIGAGYGAANGVGSGEDATSRLEGGAIGAAGGAVIGGLVPPVFAGARKLVAPLTKLLPQAAPAADLAMLPNTAPVTSITSPLEQNPLQRASAGVQKAINEMGGYAKVREANRVQRAAGRGDIVRLADLGKPFTQAADFAANNSEKAHAAIADVVDERGAGTTQRVIDDFKAVVGDVHAPTREAELSANTKAWADGPDGYGGIRANTPNVPLADAEPLVSQPRIGSLWSKAKETGQIGPNPETNDAAVAAARAENPELDKFLAANPKIDVPSLIHDPDVAAQMTALGKGHLLDALKKTDGNSFDNVQDLMHSLSDAAETAFAGRKTNLGMRMRSAADVVKKTLEDHVPGYADIADKYAERKSLERALNSGVEWFHKAADITGLNKAVESMTPEQLAQFRHGMASEQLVQLQRMSGANQATKAMIAKNNPARTNMLKLVFGDESTFDQFMERAKAERQLGQLEKTVGGSQTHGRGAAAKVAMSDELGPAAEIIKPSSHSLKHKAVKALWDHSVGPILERRANAMTPQLLTQGSDNIDLLLQLLEQNAPKPGAGSAKAAAPISSLFSNGVTRDRM